MAGKNQNVPLTSEPLYGAKNYKLMVLGVIIIALGYICLGQKPKDGILTMNIAPVLLVIGYCVILPIAFFIKPGKAEKKE
jgi:uncharacterized membrane protein HdeD (DUF308 family)